MAPQPVALPMRLWPPGPSVMRVPPEEDWQSVAVPAWMVQFGVTPETSACAPGATFSWPWPVSVVTVGALAPVPALIVMLAVMGAIPGYGVDPLAASEMTSPSPAQLCARWIVANAA